MLVLYGYKHKMEKEIWAGAEGCPVCGQVRDRFLARRRTAFTLFYVPVVWFNTGRYVINCENCQTGQKLKKAEYNRTRDALMTAYKNAEFPAYVAAQYYNKKALGKTGKIIKVVLAWIWAAVMGYFAVTSGAKALLFASKGLPEPASIALALGALILGIVPLVMAHKGLSRVNKMLKIAELYEGKVDAPAVEAAPAAEIAPAVEAAPAAEITPAAEAAPAVDDAPAAEIAPAAEAAPVAESAPAAEPVSAE